MNLSISTAETSSCQFSVPLCGEKTTIQKNVLRTLLKFRGRRSFLGPGLRKTLYKTCCDKPNREWDRSVAMMILQLNTESGHPIFRASSAFERGKLGIKEYGKKSTDSTVMKETSNCFFAQCFLKISSASTCFGRLVQKIGTQLHTKIQLLPLKNQKAQENFMQKEISEMRRLYREYMQCPKMQDAHLAETQQSLITIRPQHQQRQRKNQKFEGEKASITMSIARLDGGITESHGETRLQHLHLHLQLRSGKTHSGKWAGAHGIHHHLRNGGDFGFLEGIPNRREVWTRHPLTRHICAVQFDHSAHRTLNALSLAQVQDQAWFASIFVPQNEFCHLVSHVSSMVVLSRAFLHEHFLFFTFLSYHTTRTLSTSRTFQTLPVDKQRHQESLWRENLQSGGNPGKTTPTIYEPKELATVSRIEAYAGDPHQLYDVLEKIGEEDHRAPDTEEVDSFGEISTVGVSDSKLSRTSNIQSQMHVDDCVESTADSDLEDGQLQKILTSPLYVQRASGKPDALLSSEQGNLIRNSVFKNANPSNLRGSLLERNKEHLLNHARSDLAKQELHVESLNKCIGELHRQTEEQILALQDAQYGFVES